MAVAVIAVLSSLVAGCDTTYQQNARAKLAAARRLAAQKPHLVATRGPDIRVDRLMLLRDADSTAVVVDVHSTADMILTDVPVAVGVRRGDRKVLLNGGKDLDYFQTHLPAVPAHGKATWVFRSPPGGAARKGDEAFVRIGVPTGRTTAASLPSLRAALAGPVGGTAKVTLDDAQIPQIDLPVFVVARRGRVPVAAGAAVVDALDRHLTITTDVPMTGRAGQLPASVVVVPTIFN